MNKQENKMREEARQEIINTLKGGYMGHYYELHDYIFNTHYYEDDIEEAKETLNNYGVWKALEKVQQYERDIFGTTGNSCDPVVLVNMLYYIIGQEVLFEMLDNVEILDNAYNNKADEETNLAILKALGVEG